MLWKKKTHERSGSAKLVSFAKGFSKRSLHFAGFFRWFPNISVRFPFEVKVGYFILQSILVYSFVIFLTFFCYEQKKMHVLSRTVLFDSNVYMFKRKLKWTTAYQRVISSRKSSGHLLSVSALMVHFDIYLYFSLNDRLLVISLVTSC